MDKNPIIGQVKAMTNNAPHIAIHGTGKTAQVLCLALGQKEGLQITSPALAAAAPAPTGAHNVLAISPDNRDYLKNLGVWQHIPQTNNITAMDIYDSKGGYLPLAKEPEQKTLATLISNDDLAAAIYKELHNKTIPEKKGAKDIDLLIDCVGDKNIWQKKPLTYDYKATAIVCLVEADTPHQNRACQIFTPYGPLALLPCAQATQYACIWSQDQKRAAALAHCPDIIFREEMNRSCAIAAIHIIKTNTRHTYPLHLSLAQHHYAPKAVLVGEAAHRIHPLAGQGFNIALRDIKTLSELIDETRTLGLEIGSTFLGETYQNRRRPQAVGFAALTHNLNHMFHNPLLAPFASIGLSALEGVPSLQKGFFDIANGKSLEL